MRARIAKAKAFIAVRNYNAAIFELENIRRETSDPAVHSVTNVLLMNSYLEQGDYKRAQDLLGEYYAQQKTAKANASPTYMAVAGQVVKSARMRAERYKVLGLNPSDRSLPLEAVNDLEKMRETLELVITHSKEIGADKARAADAMMLLEEASSSRGMIARDDYDARRWRDEVADTREKLTNGRTVVLSAVPDGTTAPASEMVAQNSPPPASSLPAPVSAVPEVVAGQPQTIREREAGPAEKPPVAAPAAQPSPAPAEQPATEKVVYVSSAPRTEESNRPADAGASSPEMMNVGGSLAGYATNQVQPIYPPIAKSTRTTGTVRVEVVVSENGEVAEVKKTSGPSLLQSAARDAILKWRFKPFLRDGEPVKATGFVNFNFAL